MANLATEFWVNGSDEYQQIAKTFYDGITYEYPDRVTSRRMCPCLEYMSWCGHPLEGKAEYVEYRGESI